MKTPSVLLNNSLWKIKLLQEGSSAENLNPTLCVKTPCYAGFFSRDSQEPILPDSADENLWLAIFSLEQAPDSRWFDSRKFAFRHFCGDQD